MKEIHEQILCFLLSLASSEIFFLGHLLETDSDFIEKIVIPKNAFHMQHFRFVSRLSHNLTNGSAVDRIFDVVFTTYQANRNHQSVYGIQIVDDVGNSQFVMKHEFAAFKLSRRIIPPNFHWEQLERETVYFFGECMLMTWKLVFLPFFRSGGNQQLPSWRRTSIVWKLAEQRWWTSCETRWLRNYLKFFAWQPSISNNATSQWQQRTYSSSWGSSSKKPKTKNTKQEYLRRRNMEVSTLLDLKKIYKGVIYFNCFVSILEWRKSVITTNLWNHLSTFFCSTKEAKRHFLRIILVRR